MRTLVIIPAYNEGGNIKKVIENLAASSQEVDYIVVNDCSTDNTDAILKSINACYLKLPVNLGIGGAMQTGYKYAYMNNYDIAIQMDGDGQHDARYISDLIVPIVQNQADLVVGSRFITKEGFQSSAMRRVGIKFLSKIVKWRCGVNIKDITSGFRAVNKKYIKQWAEYYPVDYPEPESMASAVLSGCRVMEVPVVMQKRESGKSSISSLKSVYYMVKVSLAILLCRKGES